jgi:hypothetical protein
VPLTVLRFLGRLEGYGWEWESWSANLPLIVSIRETGG